MTSYTDLRKIYIKEWHVWYKMIYSCENNNQYYVETQVCDEWKGPNGFIEWLDHLGPRPGDDYVLSRINKLGDYEPGNVEWATKKQSQQKLRCHVDPEQRAYYKNIALENGIHRGCFYRRVRDGWPLRDAATIPPSQKKYKSRIVE